MKRAVHHTSTPTAKFTLSNTKHDSYDNKTMNTEANKQQHEYKRRKGKRQKEEEEKKRKRLSLPRSERRAALLQKGHTLKVRRTVSPPP